VILFRRTERTSLIRIFNTILIREARSLRLTLLIWAAMMLFGPAAPALEAQSTHVASQPSASESLSMQQLHQALRLAQSGDRQGAMASTLQLLERNPAFAPALKLKGMLLEQAGQSSEAAATYEQALQVAPNDPDLLLKTGIYALAAGDRERAISRLRRCAEILPGDGDAQFYLAQAYHLNGQDDRALTAIRQSLKAEPDNPAVWQKYGELLCGTGDCNGGLTWLLKAEHADTSLPRIDYDIANTNYKLMDIAGAVAYARRAVQMQPKDFEALRLLATANAKLANWEEALKGFEQMVSIKSDDVVALLGIGQCKLELKDYDGALQSLQSALRLDPTRLLAHFYLSRAYAGMGRKPDADHEAALHQLMMEQATFARSTAQDEHEQSIKAQARQLLRAHREQSALSLYQAHFKGSSATLADAYVFIGKLYLFQDKTYDGLRCLHQALKLQPTVRGAHSNEGILALKLGDLSRAESEFQAELVNDPSYQLAIAELGEVRYHQGRWAEAAEQLAKSKTTTPELLYMLCDSYFHLGKVAEANLNAEAMAAYARNKPDVMRGLIELLNRNQQTKLANKLQADLGQ
jgi:tetratricopeptide (TPR) repeat protein